MEKLKTLAMLCDQFHSITLKWEFLSEILVKSLSSAIYVLNLPQEPRELCIQKLLSFLTYLTPLKIMYYPSKLLPFYQTSLLNNRKLYVLISVSYWGLLGISLCIWIHLYTLSLVNLCIVWGRKERLEDYRDIGWKRIPSRIWVK